MIYKNLNYRRKSIWNFTTIFFIVIVAVFLVWLAFWGTVIYKTTSFALTEDWSGGLKPVIEKVWCGEKGCLGK